MLGILGSILLGAALGAIVGMIINFVVLGIRNLLDRIKTHNKGTVAEANAKNLLAEVMEIEHKKNNSKNIVKLNELEKLLGDNSVVEAHIDAAGKVNPDDVHILKAEKMEEPLRKLFDEHGGLLEIECA
ncbi:MAG: hypothetical protein IKW08_03780 [Roseburia sp.]|nr:hypothetical protein [Roseburia sp.]